LFVGWNAIAASETTTSVLQFCSSWQHVLRNERRTRNQNRFTAPTVRKRLPIP
jgi:hypothetical protein